MKRLIQEIESKDDPQDLADCLLESVIRYQQHEILDDMTVVVGKVKSISALNGPHCVCLASNRMERPRTVS